MIKLEKLHRGNEQNLQKIGEEQQPTIKEKEREQGKTLTNRENHIDLLYPATLAGKRFVVVNHFTVHCILPHAGGGELIHFPLGHLGRVQFLTQLSKLMGLSAHQGWIVQSNPSLS